MERKRTYTWGLWATFSLVASIASALMGFYKMYIYDNPDSYYATKINVYVGGDAYNYIINAGYATAFFTLASLFMIAAIGCMVLEYLYQIKSQGQTPQRSFINAERPVTESETYAADETVKEIRNSYENTIESKQIKRRIIQVISVIVILVLVALGIKYKRELHWHYIQLKYMFRGMLGF